MKQVSKNHKLLKLTTENGFEIEVNWVQLEKAMGTLLFLAPKELRQDPKLLEDLYEMKRSFTLALEQEDSLAIDKSLSEEESEDENSPDN